MEKSFTTDCCRLLTGLNQNTFRTFHIFFLIKKSFKKPTKNQNQLRRNQIGKEIILNEEDISKDPYYQFKIIII